MFSDIFPWTVYGIYEKMFDEIFLLKVSIRKLR
jgi:hypothetical protein